MQNLINMKMKLIATVTVIFAGLSIYTLISGFKPLSSGSELIQSFERQWVGEEALILFSLSGSLNNGADSASFDSPAEIDSAYGRLFPALLPQRER